jgi:hypothetical protein
MTQSNRATAASTRPRWQTIRWIALAVVVIAVVATLSTYLTAPRPGGRMDPESTSPDGARALVSLLRDRGVDVVTADNVDAVRRAVRPDSLLVVVQTFYLADEHHLRGLAELPGDRLIVEPSVRTREILAPDVRLGGTNSLGGEPKCDLREATRAGDAQFGLSDTYEAAGDVPVTRCYDGAVARYTDGGRTVTVVGTADFMANSGLLKQGNAALAMNLAGTRSLVVWFAPQHFDRVESTGDGTILDLIPDRVWWVVYQLCLAVALVAVWRGRRIGPLVAERLPVVVRASETVEGRGRLYRSRRARDRAAEALRAATLQRLSPRLGLGPNPEQAAVVRAVAERSVRDPAAVGYALFGPPPATDTDLVNLAHELDDIERQVARS